MNLTSPPATTRTHLALWPLAGAIALGACQKEAVRPADKASPPPAAVSAKPAGDAGVSARVIEMRVTEDGYEPANLKVKRGEPLELRVTRITAQTCATELIIEGTDINADLPLNQQVAIAWTPSRAGTLKFGCAMGMMISGVLVVE